MQGVQSSSSTPITCTSSLVHIPQSHILSHTHTQEKRYTNTDITNVRMRRTCGRFDGSPSFETRTPCYYVMGPNNTDRFYGSRSHNVFGPLKYVHFTVCVAASTAYGPSLDVHRRPSRLEPVKLAITINSKHSQSMNYSACARSRSIH